MTSLYRVFGLVLISLVSLFAVPCHAQAAAQTTDSGGELTPDRPGYTNGSDTVAPGHAQVEVGVTRTQYNAASGGGHTTDAPETLIRTGLTDTVELRLTLPNSLWPSGSRAGFSDGSVGIRDKFYQSKDGNTKFAFTPTFSIPIKSAVTQSGHVDPTFLLSGQTTSGARWGISSNLILAYPTQNGKRLTDYTVTGQVTYALSGPLSVFGDLYADAPAGSAPSTIADTGVTLKIAPNAQLDLETGWGIGGTAPTQFYGGGLALRF